MKRVEITAAQLSRDVYESVERLSTLCRTRGSYVADWYDHAGSQAALIKGVGEAYLVFRGTEATRSLLDIAADLKVMGRPWAGAGWAHRGFADALERVRYPARRLAETVSSEVPLYVTGHSLGGALATLYAAWVSHDSRFGHRIAGLITFGAPRAATPSTLAPIAERIPLVRRFAVAGDVVPHLPPLIYSHPVAVTRLATPAWWAGPLCRHDAGWYARATEQWAGVQP